MADVSKIVVALGGNLGSPEATFKNALPQLSDRVGRCIKVSNFIETTPLVMPGVDPSTVPVYLNGAALFETELSPQDCLTALLEIEGLLGRDRSKEGSRWESRIIDLDLICMDSQCVNTDSLTLPHPEMHKRLFVLEPMAEIWPEWIHPLMKRSVHELLADLKGE